MFSVSGALNVTRGIDSGMVETYLSHEKKCPERAAGRARQSVDVISSERWSAVEVVGVTAAVLCYSPQGEVVSS